MPRARRWRAVRLVMAFGALLASAVVVRALHPLERTFENPTPAVLEHFGWAVAQMGDTANVLVGAPYDYAAGEWTGAAYAVNGANGAVLGLYQNPAPAALDQFGYAVAWVNGTPVVGAPGDDNAGGSDAGAVYVLNPTTGVPIATLEGTGAGDALGTSIAAFGTGTEMLVGAPGADVDGQRAGAVYVVNSDTGTVSKTCPNPSPAAGDWFGHAVAAMGTRILVGAPYDDTGAQDSGTVYILDGEAAGGACPVLYELHGESPVGMGDRFGFAVASVPGSHVLVGAPYGDPLAPLRGAAFVFNGETGALVTTLRSPEAGTAANTFGWSVAAVGSNLLIGAPQDDTGVENAGAVYLFDGPEGTLLETITNPRPVPHGLFGHAVLGFRTRALVGAPYYSDAAPWQGAAYLYALSCGNGLLETGIGEACDDGATLDDDCCASNCQMEPDGTDCEEDGTLCTVGTTCVAGNCGACNPGTSCEDECGNPAVCTLTQGRCRCAGTSTSTTSSTSTTTSSSTTSTYPLGALPLPQDVATDLKAELEFLYTGPDPVQTGVTPTTITRRRAGGITGRVLTESEVPLAGVTVTVYGHPEFGQTLTQSDGRFHLAVNGGETLVVRYEKTDYLPADRTVDVGWQEFRVVEDVVLIQRDPVADTINLATPGIQVAQGEQETDTDGDRQAVLLFKENTDAYLTFPDGSRQPITEFHVRATEYTVGPTGPRAMPAPLPPLSGYTYAVELEADEVADTPGATGIEFDGDPVVLLVDNFLDFNVVGTGVPVGYYDRTIADWVPVPDGTIINIVGEAAGGLAEINIDSDPEPEDAATLFSQLGIDADERAALWTRYGSQVGQNGKKLWRVRLTHFSAYDCNWGYGGPVGAKAPDMPPPTSNESRDPQECTQGSVIGCQSQTLGESIGITGTPLRLAYRSDGVEGRKPALIIPLTDSSPPETLPPDFFKKVEVSIEIAGKTFVYEYPPADNLVHVFNEWDGTDWLGRPVQGSRSYEVTITYVYQAVPLASSGGSGGSGFGSAGTSNIIGDRARLEIRLFQKHRGRLGYWRIRELRELGGWNFDVHHAYDVPAQVLLMGTGERRAAGTLELSPIIQTIAGTGTGGNSGDGLLATHPNVRVSPTDITTAPDGSIYFVNVSDRVRRIDGADGVITRVAGGGMTPTFDPPILATEAELSQVRSLARGRDGSLYIGTFGAGVGRVLRVDPVDEKIRYFAGGGSQNPGDGSPALSATLGDPRGLAVGPDGSVYIATGACRVRRVSTSGIITTVAGSGVCGSEGDGFPATDLQVETQPFAVEVTEGGAIYILETGFRKIRRVDAEGIIETVLNGNGANGDGEHMSDIKASPKDLRLLPSNGFLFLEVDASVPESAVRLADSDGFVRVIGGSLFAAGFSGDGGPAAAAELSVGPQGVAVLPDGSILVSDTNRIRRIAPPLPPLGEGDAPINIPSEDGDEVYEFSAKGKHLRTRDARTGANRWTFGYNAVTGLLETVTDVAGRVTTILRTNGVPTKIKAPGGQETTLTLFGGYLTSVKNEAGEEHVFTYGDGGLLETHRDPAGHLSQYEHGDGGPLNAEGGLLEHATDATSATKDLSREELQPGRSYKVTLTTPLEREQLYEVFTQTTGDLDFQTTGFDGLVTTFTRRPRRTDSFTTPDGMTDEVTWGPTSRFAMLAPAPKEFKRKTPFEPNQLIYTRTETREASLSDPTDPFSYDLETRTVVVNTHPAMTEVYDKDTGTLTETTSEGRVIVTVLDARGRVQSRQVGALEPFTFAYDTVTGKLQSVTQGTGPSARILDFEYDENHRLKKITDPLDRETELLDYDLADRVHTQRLPAIGGQTHDILFRYTPDGLLEGLTPPGYTAAVAEHAFQYSPVHLETRYEPPAIPGVPNPDTVYEYNGDRQLEKIIRPDGQAVDPGYDLDTARLTSLTTPTRTLTYGYDAKGRLSSVVGLPPDETTLSYGYNGPLLTSMTWGRPVVGGVGLGYDNDFRLAATNVNGTMTATFEYDDDGLLESVTGPAPAGEMTFTRDSVTGFGAGLLTGTKLDVVEDTRSYTSFGELDSYAAFKMGGNPVYLAVSYQAPSFPRDALGRIRAKTESVLGGPSQTTVYGYDPRGRLETVTPDSGPVVTYVYDANGNRKDRKLNGVLMESGTYDNQDRLETYTGATYNTYTYTANGELATKTINGVPTNYTYDALGNLLTVAPQGGPVIEYVVDAQNRRIKKSVGGTFAQAFLWEDQLRVAAELDDTGAVVSRFVYGTRVNVPDYMVKGSSVFRIITDHLGSPRLVVDVNTGVVRQRIDYDEFGRVTSQQEFDASGAPVASSNVWFQPFGFSGGLYDPDTKLVRFGARDYDAMTGRWTAKDPALLVLLRSIPNAYAYSVSDPVNRVDPYGLIDYPWPANGAVANGSPFPVVVLANGQYHLLNPGESTPDAPFDSVDVDGVWGFDGHFYTVPGANNVQIGPAGVPLGVSLSTPDQRGFRWGNDPVCK